MPDYSTATIKNFLMIMEVPFFANRSLWHVILSGVFERFPNLQFVMTEQRARVQSRAEVVPLGLGQAVIFPVATRPIEGKRGPLRVNMRHGVSRLHSGKRMTLGLIFHDAA